MSNVITFKNLMKHVKKLAIRQGDWVAKFRLENYWRFRAVPRKVEVQRCVYIIWLLPQSFYLNTRVSPWWPDGLKSFPSHVGKWCRHITACRMDLPIWGVSSPLLASWTVAGGWGLNARGHFHPWGAILSKTCHFLVLSRVFISRVFISRDNTDFPDSTSSWNTHYIQIVI